MKYLFLMFMIVSIGLFATDSAPKVQFEEVPNFMAKVLSVDKVNSTLLISVGDKVASFKMNKNTHVRFIGRLGSKRDKKVSIKEMAKGLKVSISSRDFFYDLKKNKVNSKKIYTLEYLEIGNQK